MIGDFAPDTAVPGRWLQRGQLHQGGYLLDCLKESGLASVGFAPGFDRQGKPDAAKQAEAVALAQKAEVVLLCLGLDEIKESEGLDRGDMRLADNQIELLKAVQRPTPTPLWCSARGFAGNPVAQTLPYPGVWCAGRPGGGRAPCWMC